MYDKIHHKKKKKKKNLQKKKKRKKHPFQDFSGGLVIKNLPAHAGNTISIPGLGRSYMLQATKVKVKVKLLSPIQLFVTPWTIAYQDPQSMEFSRQEYWSGLPFPSPGDLPDPGIEPRSPALQADALLSEPAAKPAGN